MSADACEIDLANNEQLEELLAFAAEHGTPRATTATGYRELLVEAATWTGFVVRTDDGIRAVALPSIQAAIGLDQAQLNAFLVPGAQDAFDAVLGAVDVWARARGAVAVTAHVSAPTDDDLAAWAAAGFEQVGERARVVLDVTSADADREPVEIEGAAITTLDERPELAASADGLWRIAHDDVPSALRFAAADVPSLASELQRDAGSTAIVAVDEHDEVIGLALLRRRVDGSVAGHRMTATARAWRGRGVAHALKVAAIRWSAANGVLRLQASNDSGNAPMQAVNDRLGYRLDYRLVLLRRAVG